MVRFILAASVALTGCGEEPPFPEDYTTSWKQVKPCTEGSVHGGDTIRVFANDLAQPTYTDWAQRIDPELGTLPPGEMVAFQPGSVLLDSRGSAWPIDLSRVGPAGPADDGMRLLLARRWTAPPSSGGAVPLFRSRRARRSRLAPSPLRRRHLAPSCPPGSSCCCHSCANR